MNKVITDPNKDASQIYFEYMKQGKTHNGALILACHDLVTLITLLARATILLNAVAIMQDNPILADKLPGQAKRLLEDYRVLSEGAK